MTGIKTLCCSATLLSCCSFQPAFAQAQTVYEGLTQAQLCNKSDAIYYNATILTMDKNKPQAEAIAVTNERITAVGDKKTLIKLCKGNSTKMVDLNQATVTPGFIDTHSHFIPYGALSNAKKTLNAGSMNDYMRPNWQALRTTDSIIKHYQDFLKKHQNYTGILAGYGYDETRTKGPMLSNKLLDKISTKLPILIIHSSGHKAFTNTAMNNWLKQAFKKEGLKVCSGKNKPSACITLNPIYLKTFAQGVVQEDVFAKALVLLAKSAFFDGAAKRASVYYANRGYTTINEGLGLPGLLAEYDKATQDRNFPVDVVYNSFNLEERKLAQALYNDNKRLVLGPVKFFADGSPQSFTAYMLKPFYKQAPGKPKGWRGAPAMPIKQFKQQINDTIAAGYEVAIHNIGDAATQLTLDAVSEALKNNPKRHDARPLFIHSYFATPKQMQQMKAMNGNATFTISHIYYWGQIMCNEVVGPKLAQNYNPLGWASKYLNHFSFNSDAPVTMPDPFFQLSIATMRQPQLWNYPLTKECPKVLGPEQRITIKQGLEALTIHAANIWKLEKDKGSLEVGKLADMAIMDKNPLSMQQNPDALRQIKILGTVHRGTYRKANVEAQKAYTP